MSHWIFQILHLAWWKEKHVCEFFDELFPIQNHESFLSVRPQINGGAATVTAGECVMAGVLSRDTHKEKRPNPLFHEYNGIIILL
jgi:hypothetical protein